MKKIFIYCLVLLTFLYIVLAENPYTVSLYDTYPYDGEQNGCTLYQENIYCLSNDGNIFKYDIVQKNMSIVGTYTKPIYYSWLASCELYQNLMVCGWENYPIGGFTINLDTFEQNSFSDSFGLSHDRLGDCALRPGTDELWCLGCAGNSCDPESYPEEISPIVYYDLSEGVWTELDVINDWNQIYVNGTPLFVHLNYCSFRNSNELYCTGSGSGGPGKDMFIYDIATDDLIHKETSVNSLKGFCRWYDDKMYCYALDDNDVGPVDGSYVYDPVQDSFQSYVSPFPEPFSSWESCLKYDEYTDYCLAGYTTDYSYSPNIYKITYPEITPEPTPEPVPTTSGGNNNAFFINQNLQKAAEATPSQPTNIFEAIHQFIMDLRKRLGLE